MTRVGLIARCDAGGLGNQTWEAWRALKPDKTLVVLTGHRTRGECDEDRYTGPGVTSMVGLPERADALAFMDGLDVVFSAETVYTIEWMRAARELGLDVVVQANPEMWDGEAAGARVVLPTCWEAQRFPTGTPILACPIALDRFADRARVRTEATTFYHPAAPAMADRNGTGLLLAALRHVTEPVRVIVRGASSKGAIARGTTPRRMPSNVELVELSHSPGPYYDAYPDADVLLLPRRYGGLCLPAQEAAALGMPAVMLALEPQLGWPHVEYVPPTTSERLRVKGGAFHAWSCDPRVLAETIDHLARTPAHVEELSRQALAWADARSWEMLLPAYRQCLS